MVAPLAVARIALPIPVHELFDYQIPDTLASRLRPGVRVRVPVGNSFRTGFCVECVGESKHEDLKPIDAVLDDEPLLDDELLDFVRWTASYYYASVGEAIDCAVPKGTRKKEKTVRWARIAESLLPPEPERGTGREKRERIREWLAEAGAQPVEAVLARLDVTEAPLRTLEKRGVVEIFDAPAPRPSFDDGPTTSGTDSPPRLSADQLRSVAEIDGALDREEFECFLLHGVTGSGKTEVYLHAIASTVERGRGALILVPEIALTPQTVRRFRARLGEVAVLHSLLPAGERAEQYRRLRRGEVRVAIGARSAIFAPIPDLGIIVVDESHESSYKQENSPRYHARDLAVLRAMRRSIPCVLGTATPSLETYHNAKSGKYTYLELPERVTAHSLPEIEVIDLSKNEEHTGGPLSRRLEKCLAETLEDDGQALLFLNRRGFARQVFCGSCGYSFECEACDIPLTYHKRQDRALCHYCGTVERIPPKCPECDFPGLGRRRDGTERIEENLAERFPDVVIDRLDRDTATSATRLEAILDRFRRGETRILVGTQMVAKGHDIPGVTLVGVLDADIALQQPDFRAAERTAQLLCQVAGRAGRGDKPG
ncbi:MAG: primosomal protein N', partial [Planctomycetota bacterium]